MLPKICYHRLCYAQCISHAHFLILKLNVYQEMEVDILHLLHNKARSCTGVSILMYQVIFGLGFFCAFLNHLLKIPIPEETEVQKK